jgi:hypothetical protein
MPSRHAVVAEVDQTEYFLMAIQQCYSPLGCTGSESEHAGSAVVGKPHTTVAVVDQTEYFKYAIQQCYSTLASTWSETEDDDVGSDSDAEEAYLRDEPGEWTRARRSSLSLADVQEAAAQSGTKPGLMRRTKARSDAAPAPTDSPRLDGATVKGRRKVSRSHSYAYMDADVTGGEEPKQGAAHVRCSIYGLSASEVEVALRTYGANQLRELLPDLPAAKFRAIAYVLSLRPAAYATGALAVAHLGLRDLVPAAFLVQRGILPHARLLPRSSFAAGAAALGISAAILGGCHFLERYVAAFDRFHEHVRLAQYALHRKCKGVEEEEHCLVTRQGHKLSTLIDNVNISKNLISYPWILSISHLYYIFF